MAVIDLVEWRHVDRPARHRLAAAHPPPTVAPPLGALLGLGVVVLIWSRIGPMPTTLGWAASAPDSGPDSGYGVVRDELFRLHEPGRDLDTGWGLYLGAAQLGLLTLLLFVPHRPNLLLVVVRNARVVEAFRP